MTPVTLTLGIAGVVLSLLCWASFLNGAAGMLRAIRLGQPDPSRWRPVLPRLRTMLVEFAAHTRMVRNRTAGISHWFVMIGFLGGAILWFEAYGQTFDPRFHWPLIGDTAVYHLLDEILGVGTVVGILVLITIRQVRGPRRLGRGSRFSGSRLGAAYFVEYVVLVEGLGMLAVKAGKIATFGHADPWTDFVTMQIAELLPSSVVLVSAFAFVKLMSGMVWLLLVGRNITWGVAWHRFSAFFNIYLKREASGRTALGAVKPMTSRGRVLDLDEADPEVDTFGVGKIEDFSWKGWLDFTTCTECGRCQSQCPAWNTGKPLSPKLLIMSLREHGYQQAPYLLRGEDAPDRSLVRDVIDPDVLWSCTTCGACVEQCPVDIEHVDHIVDMRRYQVLIESEFPSELAGLFKNLETKGNPWGQNSQDRLNWIDELGFDVPVYGRDVESFQGFEYLFWVGCAGAYEDRAKKTTKAVAELLATAGVKFLVLGAGETCTGDSARRAGNEFLFQQLAQQNIETLGELFDGVEAGRRKIVVSCAHCFNTLSNEYPQLGASGATGDGTGAQYEVVHHTQLLNRLVRAKKLVPVASVGGGVDGRSADVTYHDPCYLGRHNKVYREPRELIESTGTVREMPRHAERSMCCGAGGARMWMEETLGKRINLERTDEAIATGAKTVATGCPFCRVMLADGVTARQDEGVGEGVRVVDVAQLLLDRIDRVEPAQLTARLHVEQEPRRPAEVPVEKPATEPEPVVTAQVAQAAPAKGLAMKGMAKRPGVKVPGKPAPVPETQPTAAPPTKGLAMKGIAKRPGAKSVASTPAAEPATATVSTSAAATPSAPPVKGLAMKGAAKAPGRR